MASKSFLLFGGVFFEGSQKSQNWNGRSDLKWVNWKRRMISISNIKWDMWHCRGNRSGKDISAASTDLRHSWKPQTVVPAASFTGSIQWIYLYGAFRSLGRCESSTGCGKEWTAHFPAIPPQTFTALQHKSCIFFKAWWKLQIPSLCFVKRHRSSNPVCRSSLVMILISSFLFISPDLCC